MSYICDEQFANNRIVVIDDNASIQRDFCAILKPAQVDRDFQSLKSTLFGEDTVETQPPCFQVDTAHQGKEGYELIKAAYQAGQPYAVAFVDMRMPPGWDGLETILQIWSTDPEIEIVICTAYSDYSWQDITSRLGKFTERLLILKKPFDDVEVLQLANALTQKWQLKKQALTQRAELEDLVRKQTQQVIQAKNELEISEKRARAILDATTDSVLLTDADGTILDINETGAKRFGYTPNKLIGNCIFDIQPPDLAKARRAKFQEVVRSGTLARFEDTRAGMTFDNTMFPVFDTDGKVESVAMYARDITQRKKLEMQLLHAQKLEAVGQLAAGIAHEINTPTQFVTDSVTFLKDAFEDQTELIACCKETVKALESSAAHTDLVDRFYEAQEQADLEYLEEHVPDSFVRCLDGLSRIGTIVNAMKEFAHPEQRTKSAINLNQALQATLIIAKNEYKYAADLETDWGDLPPVVCHASDINQVLLNLIVNAAHAIEEAVGDTQNRGVIRVRTARDDGFVRIEVEDTGRGIPEEIRNRIFEPFFTTKKIGKGTGQGLAIAHSIVVNKHNGSLTFKSDENKGTTFIMRLPCDIPPNCADA